MSNVLSFIGRHGPAMLFASVLVGVVLPGLADAAQPLMGAAVFVFTAGGFLKVRGAPFAEALARPARLAAILAWVLFGVPLVAWAAASSLALPAGIATALVLCMCAPPVGSAASIAAMLRMNTALALVGSVALSLASPLYLPWLMSSLGGTAVEIDTVRMAARIAGIVVGAAAVSAVLRRYADGWLTRHPDALTGTSVVGLVVVGLGVMKGMQPMVLEQATSVAAVVGIAFAVNAGFQLLGIALFLPLGLRDAASVGLLGGYRNVTLVAVVAAPWLAGSPQVHLYIAASVLPIFMMPLITQALVRGFHAFRGRSTGRLAVAP